MNAALTERALKINKRKAGKVCEKEPSARAPTAAPEAGALPKF